MGIFDEDFGVVPPRIDQYLDKMIKTDANSFLEELVDITMSQPNTIECSLEDLSFKEDIIFMVERYKHACASRVMSQYIYINPIKNEIIYLDTEDLRKKINARHRSHSGPMDYIQQHYMNYWLNHADIIHNSCKITEQTFNDAVKLVEDFNEHFGYRD